MRWTRRSAASRPSRQRALRRADGVGAARALEPEQAAHQGADRVAPGCRRRNRAPDRHGRQSRRPRPGAGTPPPGGSCRCRPRRAGRSSARRHSPGRPRACPGTGQARRGGRRTAGPATGALSASPAKRQARTGRVSPLNARAPASVQAKPAGNRRRTASEIRISPLCARSVRRAARFTNSPVTVYSLWASLPIPLATT